VRSADGTEIAYTTTEASTPGAPWIVLVNGPWSPQPLAIADYLGDRYRFVRSDFRGLGASGCPKDEAAYAIERHADDLEAVLDACGIEHAFWLAFHMGAQVAVETLRRRPSRARALVLVSASVGRAPPPCAAAALALRWGEATAISRSPSLDRAARAIAGSRVGRRALVATGLLGDTLSPRERAERLDALREIRLGPLLRTVAAARGHDAASVLRELDLPVLVVAGDRDRLLPDGAAVRMTRQLSHAELLTVRGGSHFMALEFPELIALRIEQFFGTRSFETRSFET